MRLNSTRINDLKISTKLLLGMLLLCGLLTGVAPQSFIDMAVIAICALLFIDGNLILAYPFMLLYYSTFGLVFGVSTYRVFSLMLLVESLLKLNRKSSFQPRFVLPLFVLILYLITVMSDYSIQRAIFTFVDILCVLAAVSHFNEDSENVRIFFEVYLLVCLLSIATGIITQNSYIEQRMMEDYTIYRFSATLNDPNYMGFFMTAAIFATVALKLFNPFLRWLMIGIMYAAILASASITAIVVHAILWPVYLLVDKKINIKTCIAGIIVVTCALSLYQYGLENPEAPVIGNISYRIQEKLTDWEAGDISGVTTSRSDLVDAHWNYFLQLPYWRQLFGGTPTNSIFISDVFEAAAHNEYVDMLLNIGIIGTAIFLWFMISGTVKHLLVFRQTNDKTSFCIFMVKCVWLAYAMTLTMFLDFRFMLPFFI